MGKTRQAIVESIYDNLSLNKLDVLDRLCKNETCKDKGCPNAHALWELTLPEPTTYDSENNDRWVGQQMSESQIERIKYLFQNEKCFDIPGWAKGLFWFLDHEKDGAYPECAWDFGLYADAYLYRPKVTIAPELSDRLQKRLRTLELESERQKRRS